MDDIFLGKRVLTQKQTDIHKAYRQAAVSPGRPALFGASVVVSERDSKAWDIAGR